MRKSLFDRAFVLDAVVCVVQGEASRSFGDDEPLKDSSIFSSYVSQVRES